MLQKAIVETFKKREMQLTEVPIIFTEKFIQDTTKQLQWKAFLKRIQMQGVSEDFPSIMVLIQQFLGPLAAAAATGQTLNRQWDPKAFGWKRFPEFSFFMTSKVL